MRRLIVLWLLFLVGSVAAAAETLPKAGIASAHPLATRAGFERLIDVADPDHCVQITHGDLLFLRFF